MRKNILLTVLLFVLFITAAESSTKIAVLFDQDSKLSTNLAKAFKREMERRLDIYLTDFDLDKKKQREALIILTKNGRYSFTLALGSNAARFCADNDLPGVFMLVRDPYHEGLIDPVTQLPKKSLTGISAGLNPDKIFSILSKVLPNGTAGLVYSKEMSDRELTKLEIASQTYSYSLAKKMVTDTDEIIPAFYEISKKATCYISTLDGMIFNAKSFMNIIKVSMKNKIPLIGLSHAMTEKGALISFYSDNEDLAKQSSLIMERLLAGEQPKDIPFAYPEKILYSLNMKTSKLLKLNLSEEIIAQADKVK